MENCCCERESSRFRSEKSGVCLCFVPIAFTPYWTSSNKLDFSGTSEELWRWSPHLQNEGNDNNYVQVFWREIKEARWIVLQKNIYIYVCVCVYVCIYIIYVYTHIHIYIILCINIRIHIKCTYTYIHIYFIYKCKYYLFIHSFLCLFGHTEWGKRGLKVRIQQHNECLESELAEKQREFSGRG